MKRRPMTNDIIIELLEEVIEHHADPDDNGYNECDDDEGECLWCSEAKRAIEFLKPPQEEEL